MLSLSSLEIKLKPVAIATKPFDCGVNALFGVSALRTIFARSNNFGSFLSRWHFVPWLIVSLCELERKETLHLCQRNSLSAKDKLFYLLWHAPLLSTSHKIMGRFHI